MIHTSFTSWPTKYGRKNIQIKRLIDLGYAGAAIKKAIGNSEEVKELKSLLKHFLKAFHHGFEEDVSCSGKWSNLGEIKHKIQKNVLK